MSFRIALISAVGVFFYLSIYAFADPDPNLVAWWTLNEGSGTVVQNAVNNADGLLMNGPTWTNGVSGSALHFDGIDDYVDVPTYQGIIGSSSRTCMAWIKTPKNGAEILSWGSPEPGAKWVIRVNLDGTLRAEVWDGYRSGTTRLTDDQWHHVAVVLDDDGSADISEVKLYVDGHRDVIGATDPQSINTVMGDPVKIGVYDFSSIYFKGLIDDVRIYDRALSEAEIRECMSPLLRASQTHLQFFTAQPGDRPVAQTITLQNTDNQLNWSLDEAQMPDWLSVIPTSGTLGPYQTQSVTVRVFTDDLADGSRACSVPLLTDAGYNAVGTLEVNLGIGGIVVPDDYDSIQAAIDAASAGDVIFVAPGRYAESITLKNGVALIGAGSDSTVIETPNGNPTVTSINCSRSTVLSGFLITKQFESEADHGMYNTNSGPTVYDCHFIRNGNESRIQGGGVYNVNSSPLLINCIFMENQAYYGAGVYNENSSPTFRDCEFCDNGDLWYPSWGGGICNYESSIDIDNCSFSNNYAHNGGAIYNYVSSVKISRSIFRANVAIYRDHWSMPALDANGAGIYNSGSEVIVDHCLFKDSKEISDSYVFLTAWLWYGDGIYNEGRLTIQNCTFSNSYVTQSAGTMLIENSILWRAGATGIYIDQGDVTISYSDISGCGGSGDGWNTAMGTDGGGNIDADPLFVRDARGVFLKSAFGRVSTEMSVPFGSWVFDGQTSPCIDAGNPNTPVANEPEGNGGRINMGAYGGTFYASRSDYLPPVEGDLDDDRDVDMLDFARFAENWLAGD